MIDLKMKKKTKWKLLNEMKIKNWIKRENGWMVKKNEIWVSLYAKWVHWCGDDDGTDYWMKHMSRYVCVYRYTYSGLGGSLAKSVPSFRPRSFGSSGSLSVSELSIGSNGLTICCCCWWWFALDDCCEFDLLDAGACWRLFRGGASGWACC